MSVESNKLSTPQATHKQLKEFYPISGLVEGWYFRIQEDSAGCYLVEGRDIYGRMVARKTTGDPDKTLAECVEYARSKISSKHG